MAELADAQDSGSCEHLLMQVQVLLSAPLPKKTNLLLVRFSFHCTDNRLATMLSALSANFVCNLHLCSGHSKQIKHEVSVQSTAVLQAQFV